MPNLTEAEILEQLAAAAAKYRTGATGLPVQDDQTAREALDDSARTEVENDEFTQLNSTPSPAPRITAEVYTGGNVVAPVQATYMEAQVRAALDAGDAFEFGGPYTSNYVPPSPYLDSLTLIEASKLTGEKFF
jgi:hypothetical protein